MALRTFVVAVASLALMPSAAVAAAKPSFPRTYTGTISGTYSATDAGTTHKITWTIKGVRFTLVHVREAEGSWTAYYDVAAGTVSYSDVETGTCGYSLSEEFALRAAMPKHNPSTPFYTQRSSMLSRESYGGTLEPNKRWTVLEACNYPDQDPVITQRTIQPRNLFDTGAKTGRIGRTAKGTFDYTDDYAHSTTTYRWSLTPRR